MASKLSSSASDRRDVMVRLSEFRNAEDPNDGSPSASSVPKLLLVVAILLASLGSTLLLCAIAVTCAPDSAIANAVVSVCSMF